MLEDMVGRERAAAACAGFAPPLRTSFRVNTIVQPDPAAALSLLKSASRVAAAAAGRG